MASENEKPSIDVSTMQRMSDEEYREYRVSAIDERDFLAMICPMRLRPSYAYARTADDRRIVHNHDLVVGDLVLGVDQRRDSGVDDEIGR